MWHFTILSIMEESSSAQYVGLVRLFLFSHLNSVLVLSHLMQASLHDWMDTPSPCPQSSSHRHVAAQVVRHGGDGGAGSGVDEGGDEGLGLGLGGGGGGGLDGGGGGDGGVWGGDGGCERQWRYLLLASSHVSTGMPVPVPLPVRCVLK